MDDEVGTGEVTQLVRVLSSDDYSFIDQVSPEVF